MKHTFFYCCLFLLSLFSCSRPVTSLSSYRVVVADTTQARHCYGASRLETALAAQGCLASDDDTSACVIYLTQADSSSSLPREGFTIRTQGRVTTICGNDASGTLYGCQELLENYINRRCFTFPDSLTDAPEMVLRGPCIGVQKTSLLEGRGVYEYPYTPENFPWLYDREMWIRYLDLMVDNRMNSLYLWNGHPFASLVSLPDYPFAVEVDEETFAKNRDLFSFLTQEADRRGIYVIQMFYNIIVSKPFAEHYGLKTQDRNRPITPLISDYTRQSIAAFVRDYPNVGLLITLGEALSGNDRKLDWMLHTVIPGVKEGLAASHRTDEPPIILRAHDVDCRAVMDATLPIYHNIYTMHKYNGESLTTYQPQGPWAEIHKSLSSLGSIHVENVHILANLEPWRWASPDFVQKAVGAMHHVHGANALHLYPQASYWDYPYTADDLGNGQRLLQIERDWLWYATWGRYAWRQDRPRDEEKRYWDERLAAFYGTSVATGALIRTAYEESGEIAPKLLRRFGITEGNRETLLLGLFVSQLVNPYKYTIYPGFYESCGPEGEKLIEWSEREWKGEPHIVGGEMPLDITRACVAHAESAYKAIHEASKKTIGAHQDEFARLQNDMACYRAFAHFMAHKVEAARKVLDYGWARRLHRQSSAACLASLDSAALLLEESLADWRTLVSLTEGRYLYANSMQTSMRRIPIAGDNGANKTWAEMLPHYEKELVCLRQHIAQLRDGAAARSLPTQPLLTAAVSLSASLPTFTLKKGAHPFSNLPEAVIDSVTPALQGLTGYVINALKPGKGDPVTLQFSAADSVYLLVGYFRDDLSRYAPAPKLETDATANEYGQAEPFITNALKINGLPLVNIHAYGFAAGTHSLTLPEGYLFLGGFASQRCTPFNAGVGGGDETLDWLFY